MRKYIISLLLFLYSFLLIDIALANVERMPGLFLTQPEAQQKCPKDEIVWFSFKTNIYYHKSAPWYGKTKPGAYVCKKEAEAAGIKCCTDGTLDT